MKIAYVTTFDSSNEHAWSGSGHYMYKAMEGAGCSVERLGNLNVKMDFLFKMKKAYYKFLLSKNYQKQREPIILKSYAKQISRKLVKFSYDAILTPGTIPVAYLRDKKPIVFWTDATFAGLMNFFPDFSNLPTESIEQGHAMEQAALDNCALAIYSSAWAAESALLHYKVSPKKVKVVPFGANIERNPDEEEIYKIVKNKNFDVCRLLFVGVDWYRKGGDISIKVASHLNQMGIKTELHLVGSGPKGKIPPYVIAHGFLSKKQLDQKEKIDRLYEQSHFLILPSLADCVPVVIAEANSYGLPCVSTNVGGIGSTIINGVNGQTFRLDTKVDDYSRYIADLYSSPQKYREMMSTTFRQFKEKLNWNSAGKQVKDMIEKL